MRRCVGDRNLVLFGMVVFFLFRGTGDGVGAFWRERRELSFFCEGGGNC